MFQTLRVFLIHNKYNIIQQYNRKMSFNNHRRNFSLINAQKNITKIQSKSLRKIIHSSQHNWLLSSAKQHYYQQNNITKAVKQFELYLLHNPHHLQSLYLCAICKMHLECYNDAIQKLTQYLNLKKNTRRMIINSTLPPNSNVYLLLSMAYFKREHLVQALEASNRSLENDLKFVQGYCLRAKIYMKMQEIKKGYHDYATALKYNPNCLSAIIGIGDYYSNNAENYSAAMKYYSRAKQAINTQFKQKKKSEEEEKVFFRTSAPQYLAEPTNKISTYFQNTQINMEESSHRILDKTDEQLLAELELKCSICDYHLENYLEAIEKLTKLLTHQAFRGLSEPFYYLGMSQLKLYKQTSNTSSVNNSEELYQQALLNIQYSVNVKSNPQIMLKAIKNLIKLHIQNYQFYEAENVLLLAKNNNIKIEEQKQLCQSCMQIIKHKYATATVRLNKLNKEISTYSQTNKKVQKKKDIKLGKVVNADLQLSANKDKKGSSYRLKNPYISPKQILQKKEHMFEKTLPINSSNTRKHTSKNEEVSVNYTNEYQSLQILNRQNSFQWMKPIILLFLTYAQFFSDNFIECLEAFQCYESYIKDYLGKESENDIYLSYNKLLCEGILMIDNEMVEESLEKLTSCIENYYRLTRNFPIEPILFKVLILLKLSQSENPILSQQIKGERKILRHILEVLLHYRPILKNHYIAEYYRGLVLLILEDFEQASNALESCLKGAEQCHWKYLYVKGVIEIHRSQFKQAIKEFSAGLLLQEKADLYLGRCVSYILLYQQISHKNSAIVEKSFEDLQKFIQLQENSEKISLWVTKILFFNKAYEEASKSIQKLSGSVIDSQEDLAKINRNLNIYEGNFEDGGVLGRIIINAFDGKYLKDTIQINQSRHDIIESDFVQKSYVKWLCILNLYSAEKYPELIKQIQRDIFDAKDNQSEQIQLKYNLFVVYLLVGETAKAKNVIASLQKFPQIQTRVRKFLDHNIAKDQCFQDLQEEFKSIKRLSTFLGYRKIKTSIGQSLDQFVEFYIKISVPFPDFFKPNICFTVNQEFILKQSVQSCIPKKIQAPWIKKVTGNIQFTNNIIESVQSSVLVEHENNASSQQMDSDEAFDSLQFE